MRGKGGDLRIVGVPGVAETGIAASDGVDLLIEGFFLQHFPINILLFYILNVNNGKSESW